MQRFRFPIAVAATSLVLVFGLVLVGGLLARSALAGGPPWAGGGWGGHFGPNHGFTLPPELAQLHDLPADQRFSHFKGAQIRLSDRDGQPLAIDVTPGVATSVSPTSLILAENAGATRSFTLSDQTVVRGKQAVAQGDKVIVVTLNGGSTAHAMVVMSESFAPWGRPFAGAPSNAR